MPTYEHGFKRASEIISGAIVALVIRVVLQSLGLDYVIVLFDLFSIVVIIELMDKMKYWSISYLFGWIAGLVISFSVAYTFLSWWEIALYALVTAVTLIQKVARKLR